MRAGWSAAESEVAEEFIAHARAIRAEREAAAPRAARRSLVELLDGGAG